jgi:uncharacterized protein YacL
MTAIVFAHYKAYSSKTMAKFEGTLTEDQKKIYDEIRADRRRLSVEGLVLGVLIAGLYTVYLSKKRPPVVNTCMTLLIVLFVMCAYYTLMPKSKWMLNNVSSKESVDSWLEVYKMWSWNKCFGIVAGVIAYFILSNLVKGKGKEGKLTFA